MMGLNELIYSRRKPQGDDAERLFFGDRLGRFY